MGTQYTNYRNKYQPQLDSTLLSNNLYPLMSFVFRSFCATGSLCSSPLTVLGFRVIHLLWQCVLLNKMPNYKKDCQLWKNKNNFEIQPLRHQETGFMLKMTSVTAFSCKTSIYIQTHYKYVFWDSVTQYLGWKEIQNYHNIILLYKILHRLIMSKL